MTTDLLTSVERTVLPADSRRQQQKVRARRRWNLFELSVLALWTVAFFVFVGYPIVRLFLASVWSDEDGLTLQNFSLLVSEPAVLEATWNSVLLGVGAVIGSSIIGVPMAWLVARTNLPFATFFRVTAVLTFAAPSFIAAMGWVLLLGPGAGLVNQVLMSVFGLAEAPVNIFSPFGIVFVLSLFMYPLIFLPVSAAFQGIDPALEHAAISMGASRLRVLFTITLPLAAKSAMAGAMLVFVTSSVIFGPVAILGAPTGFRTLPMVLLGMVQFPPEIATAAVVSVPLLAIITVLVVIQRVVVGGAQFNVIGGKPSRSGQFDLGGLKLVAMLFAAIVFVLSIVAPFGVLLLNSFRGSMGLPLGPENFVGWENYRTILSDSMIVDAFRNSIVAAIAGTSIAVVVALVASWLVHKTNLRRRGFIVPLMLSPLAFPGAVFAIGLIIAYQARPFALGGSVTILIIAYVASALPLTYAYVDAAFGQLGSELEEAARIQGASWPRTLTTITLPLVMPAVVAAVMLNFVLLFRELEMSVFLFTGRNPTTATMLYDLAMDSRYQLVGALSAFVLLVNIVIAIFAVTVLDKKRKGS